MATSEQQTLEDILKAQSEGGAAMAGGSLGAGADVPSVLSSSPATTQLLEESIATRTGNIGEAVASSQAYTGQTGTTTPTSTAEARPILSGSTTTNASKYSQANPYAPGTASADAWEARNAQTTQPSALSYEVPEPRSLEEIRNEQLAQAQSVIDATEQLYQTEIARLEQQGRESLARTSSIAVGAGLAGSPFQQTAEAKTQEATEEVLSARRAERQAQIAQLMAAAQDQATEQYDKEIARYQQEREFAVSERDKEIVRQQAAKSALASTISNMAAGGVSIDDMSKEEYQAMLAESGMSDFEARAIWAQSSPEANAQYSIQNGQLVGYYFDPVSGKPVVTTHALPAGLTTSVSATADLKFYTDGTGQGYMFDQNNPTYDAQGNLVMQRIGSPNPVEVAGDEGAKLLSLSDAEKLGLPYGTTVAEAISQGIVIGSEEKARADEETAKIKEEYETALDRTISDIQGLINNPGLDSAVGIYKLGRLETPLNQGDRTRFIADIKRLISGETLSQLATAKERGITFGALSEQEMRTVAEAATSLQNYLEEYEEDIRIGKAPFYPNSGIPIAKQGQEYFNTTEENIVDELNRLLEPLLKEKESLTTSSTRDDVDSFLDSLGIDQSVFNKDLSTSQKGSTPQIGDTVLGLGGITGFGSDYWDHGLDIDLKIGDPVPTPAAGEVIFAGSNGGFGNQVQVRTSSGNIVMLSHLDSIGVKVGDTIRAGQVVGKGGNTGNVYSTSGGDGSHLDLTVKKPDGSYFTPQEIAQRLTMFG